VLWIGQLTGLGLFRKEKNRKILKQNSRPPFFETKTCAEEEENR
jgi:hypothetical protein